MTGDAGHLLIAEVRRRFGGRLAGIVVLMLLAALAEGAGFLLLLPIIASISGEALPGWIPALPGIGALLAAFLAVMIARALLMHWRDRSQAALERDLHTALSIDSACALGAMGWQDASLVGQARMQTLWTNEIPRSAVAVMQGLGALVAALLLGVQGAIALIFSPTLALVAAALLALAASASWAFLARARRAGERAVARTGTARAAGFDFHAGLKSALAEGREGAFLDRFAADVRAEYQDYYAIDRARADARLVIQTCAAVGLVALLATGLFVLEIAASILLLLVLLFARMFGPARQLLDQLQGFAAYAPAYRPVAALLARPPRSRPAASEQVGRDWQRIEARALMVGPDEAALGPFDLAIERGTVTALAGPSGAGKSLIVDTIAGLYPAAGGELVVDGQSFEPMRTADWAGQIAYCGQDAGLLGASVRALVDPLGEHPPGEVEAMVEAVGLGDLVRERGGIEAPMGDRASRLSGGERQRLLLARALLRHPSLLILDEATAALDVEAEAHMLALIRERRPDAAVLLVSHRDATLSRAGKIHRV